MAGVDGLRRRAAPGAEEAMPEAPRQMTEAERIASLRRVNELGADLDFTFAPYTHLFRATALMAALPIVAFSSMRIASYFWDLESTNPDEMAAASSGLSNLMGWVGGSLVGLSFNYAKNAIGLSCLSGRNDPHIKQKAMYLHGLTAMAAAAAFCYIPTAQSGKNVGEVFGRALASKAGLIASLHTGVVSTCGFISAWREPAPEPRADATAQAREPAGPSV